MRTTWGIATDRGRVREINEDAVLAEPPVFLVADGIGGYDAGDIASKIVVESFRALRGRATASPQVIHERFHGATHERRSALTMESPEVSTVAAAAIVNQAGID